MNDNKKTVIKFNDCITHQDIQGLESLMTEDHSFIDSAGVSFAGKKKALETWKGFFRQFPDYKNIFGRFETSGDSVVVVGHSECTDERLRGPALWRVVLKNDKVAVWQVYEDNDETRRELGL